MYATVQITCGTPGSGKSLTRGAAFLVNQWLLEEDGLFVTNFPYSEENLENIAQFLVGKKKCGFNDTDGKPLRLTIDDARKIVKRQIVQIPPETKRGWMDGTLSPMEFFSSFATDEGTSALSGGHVAIDEIHNYIPAKAPEAIERAWGEFVGEVRHCGATFEALSQDEYQINACIRKRAEIKRFIVKRESELIPYLKIEVGDVMQFLYKIKGKSQLVSRVYEYKRVSDKVWAPQNDYNIRLSPKYFAFYTSHSAPEKGGLPGSERKQPWQKYGWVGLVLWFMRKNAAQVFLVAAIASFAFWFFLLGGLPKIFSSITNGISSVMVGGIAQQAQGANSTDPQTAKESPKSQPTESPEQTIKRLTGEMNTLNAQLNAERQKVATIDAIQQKLTATESILNSMAEITAITKDTILLFDGTILREGDEFEHGILQGERIYKIELEHYRVLLDNGTYIRLPSARYHTPNPENRGDGTLLQRGDTANNNPENQGKL